MRFEIIGLVLSLLGSGTLGAIELEPVADGVYAVVQEPARRLNDANNAVIVTDRDVVVIDTSIETQRTRQVIAAIAELTDRPVRYLIDTHWHLDHTHGNQAWVDEVPGIEIIGHRTLLDTVPGRAVEMRQAEIEAYREAIPRVEGWVETGLGGDGEALTDEQVADYRARLERGRAHLAMLESIRPVPPTLAIDGELVLHRDSGDLHIVALAGHTDGDLIVHLPRQRVLVAGDLVDEVPYAGHGDPRVWLDSLERLAAFDFDQLIPGHGPLMEGGAQIERQRRFFAGVLAEVEARSEGASCPEGLAAAIDAGPFRLMLAPADDTARRAFEGSFPALVERICELRGLGAEPGEAR